MISRFVCRTFVSSLIALALMFVPGIAQAQTFNVAPLKVEGTSPTVAPAPAPAPKKAQVAAEFRWSGVYIGASGGYGDGKGDTTFIPSTGSLTPNTTEPDMQGFVYGFYGGVNYQAGIFVGGVEGDVMFAHMDGAQHISTFTYNNLTFNGSLEAEQELNWYSTVRGRAGVGAGGFHVYGTAGVAIGGVDHHSNVTPLGAAQFPVDQKGTMYGWTFGGGVEGKVNRLVTWRVQYLHMDFGDTTKTADPVPSGSSLTVDHKWIATTNTFTAGIGFRF
jgi:outer membrane immunogenic protein